MEEKIQSVLYIDIQRARPVARCPRCGGEVYRADGDCLQCEWLAYDIA